MNKLLFFLLIALIFGSISAGAAEEWEKVKGVCSKVRGFLQKYGIYDDVVRLLNQGAKTAATNVCKKKLSDGLCSSIISVVGKLTSKIHIC